MKTPQGSSKSSRTTRLIRNQSLKRICDFKTEQITIVHQRKNKEVISQLKTSMHDFSMDYTILSDSYI